MHRLDDYEFEMLLGNHPWDKSEERAIAFLARLGVHVELKKARLGISDEVVASYSVNLLPETPVLPALLKQASIFSEPMDVLAAEGPLEAVGLHHVPIFRGSVFGDLNGVRGRRRPRFHSEVYIVGRMDVRKITEVRKGTAWIQGVGDVAETMRGRFKPTLRKARNTALKVDAAIPAWEAYQRQQGELRQAADEARRLTEQALDFEDDGLSSF